MKQEWIDNVLCPGPLREDTIVGIRVWCEMECAGLCNGDQFKEEPIWVPFFWTIAQMGYVDIITGHGSFIVDINHVERKETTLFPELRDICSVEMTRTKSGYVLGWAIRNPPSHEDYLRYGTEEQGEIN